MSSKEEKLIELQLDPADGIYKPSSINVKRKTKQTFRKVKSQRLSPTSKQQKAIRKLASEIPIPQVQQFLYGFNTVLVMVERARKVFR